MAGLLALAELATRPPLLDFALALAIGGLVGIEREHKKRAGELATGGLRTFILIAEAGAIAGWLAQELGSAWVFAAAGLMIAAVVVAGYWLENRRDREALGMTTEIAALVVFLLGGAVVLGQAGLAVALAIATSAVLTFKEPLHGAVALVEHEDLRAGLKLLIATFIVLPVLPREPIDPWGVLEPYKMWWLVILISTLSLVGYVASRWLGARHGLTLTALAGGIVSSTAVTLGFARKSREEDEGPVDALAAGILLAWSVMLVRVVVAAAAVHRPLVARLALPMAAMAVVALLGAGLLQWRAGRSAAKTPAPDVPLKNPFSLLASIRFALFFAAVQLLVELMRRQWPGSGEYAVAALAGGTDVDAITLSMAELARTGEEGTERVATLAILIAVASNTLVKLVLVVTLGARALATRIGAATPPLLAAGALAWLVS